MNNSRYYLAMIAGILVCMLFSWLIRNSIIGLILGIFTALKIADPEKKKLGVVIGAIIGAISSIYGINKTIFAIYNPERHTVFVLVFSILFALLLSGLIGAGLGAIQWVIFQHIKKEKITL